jgi:hypothetical protein
MCTHGAPMQRLSGNNSARRGAVSRKPRTPLGRSGPKCAQCAGQHYLATGIMMWA